MEIPNQEMPAEEKPQGEIPLPSKEGITGVITGIHTNLLKLKEVLGAVPQVPDQVKGQLEGLIAGYREFVGGLSKSVQGGAQEQAPAPEQQSAPAPAAPQRPPMRGPMPMMGGNNAKPMVR